MLIISYIFSAGLELLIVYNSLVAGSWALVWTYGFLLVTTLFSVHAEDSVSGKAARRFFKSIGIRSEIYDLISNLIKILIYLLVLTNVISYYMGAFLAYMVVFFTVISVYFKFSRKIKTDKKKEDKKDPEDD